MNVPVTDVSSTSMGSHTKLEVEDKETTRCGEIFMTRNKLFTFHCTFCNDGKYDDFNSLVDHITRTHLSKFTRQIQDESINLRNSDSDRIEYDKPLAGKCDIRATDDVYQELPVDRLEHTESIKVYGIGEIKKQDDINSDSDEDWYSREIQQQDSINEIPHIECEICGRKFNKKYKWRRHVIIHSDERKHICDQCGQAFKADYNLRAHIRRHSGVKKCECTYCQRKFHTNAELITHERRVHTGERPYMCSCCGAGFLTSGLLREHMKRHNNEKPFKCQYCEKTFYNSRLRKIHEIVHTKERNHTCNVCYAAFGRRKGLILHMKLHENAREYVCDLCDAAFNQKQSLLAHKKTKHGILGSVRMTSLLESSAILDENTKCLQCQIKF